MEVLNRKFTARRVSSIIQRIGTFSAYIWEIAEQRHDTCQGRELCGRLYSCLCRYPKADSQYLPVYKKKQGYFSKLFASSSFHTSLLSEERSHGKISGVISLSMVHTRCLHTGSYHRHFNGRHHLLCSHPCTNPSVWNHMESRGLRSGRDKVGQSQDDIMNPIDRLQQFITVPLLPEDEYIFKPSAKEVAKAQQLFVPDRKHKIEFLKSALFDEHLPDYDLPEVAFIGRSNVGKSSLISMLLSQTDVFVRVSKQPGHTKLLNFFKLGQKLTLVDMPGYGFKMPEHYASSVETFLSSRKKLSRTFILVDSTVGVTEHDVVGLNMMEEFRIPYVIVLTKIDRTKPAHLLKSFMTVLSYRDKTKYCFGQPFLVSSINGEGIPLLQAFIAYVTGCVAIQGL